MKFVDPPIRTDFRSKTWDASGIPVWAWLQYLLAVSQRLTVPIISDVPPVNSASPGVAGQMAFDTAGFIYLAVATDTWVRFGPGVPF